MPWARRCPGWPSLPSPPPTRRRRSRGRARGCACCSLEVLVRQEPVPPFCHSKQSMGSDRVVPPKTCRLAVVTSSAATVASCAAERSAALAAVCAACTGLCSLLVHDWRLAAEGLHPLSRLGQLRELVLDKVEMEPGAGRGMVLPPLPLHRLHAVGPYISIEGGHPAPCCKLAQAGPVPVGLACVAPALGPGIPPAHLPCRHVMASPQKSAA